MAVLAVAGLGAFGTAALGLGWQAGWLLGGLVGQALFGPRLPDQEGPRLTDLSVTSSAYGAPIPICYGTMRMGGNMIWSTGLIETSSTARVGGKGGARGQKVTSYSYRASFAIGFGEGPADQVLRIWADGKLIFDRTGGITTGQTIARPGFRMRFYPGDETQLPDPAIVAREGAGNVPAHRGLCYIVFEDFELADFGNRIPQITAEITYRAVASFPVQRLQFIAGPVTTIVRAELAVDWERGRGFLVGSGGVRRFALRTMSEDRNVASADIFAIDPGSFGASDIFCGRDGFIYCTVGTGNSRPIVRIDPDAMREVARFGVNSSGLSNGTTNFTITIRYATIRIGDRTYLLTANGTGPTHLGLLQAEEMRYFWHENATGQSIASLTGGSEREGWVLSGSANLGRLHRIRIVDEVFVTVTREIVLEFTPAEIDPAATSFAGSFASLGAGDFGGLNFDPSDGGLVFWCGVNGANFSGRQYVVKWRPGLGMMWRTQVAIWPSAFANRQPVSSARLTGTSFGICRDTNTGRFRIIVLDLQSGAITLDSDGWVNGATALGGAQVYDAVTDSLIAYDPRGGFSRLYIGRFGADGTALSGIVADLCARGGLDLPDIDVSELTASLPGYVVGRQSTIRAALEPLAQAFFFDGVESDERLAFRNRGRAPALSINPQHLIRLDASSGEAWRERRIQEVELPARVNILYMDNATDYAQGTQTAKRVERPGATMASRNQLSLELPMALAPGQAKSIAARRLYTAWIERSTYEARLPSDYLRLEPTDVIAITLPSGASLVARLERVDLGADLSIAIQARSQEAAEYAPALAADGGIGRPVQSVDFETQTQLFLPDIPLLRDVDAPSGLASRRYIMMSGFGAGEWPGGAAYRSVDSVGWELVASSGNAAAWGVLQSVLPVPAAVFATDEDSVLALSMAVGAGRLESVTQEAMLNGANAALLLRSDGTPELVQFREVEPVAGGGFVLRGLLRGRRGTDVFAATPHPVGTRFILLEPATLEATLFALGEIGLLRQWRAIGRGGDFDLAPTVGSIALGRDLMPYAPVHLKARLVSTGIEISWARRTRIGGDLRDGTGIVPLSEASEAYALDILSAPPGSAGSTVLRTITTTAPIAIYSNADIAADFGAAPSSLTLSVAQISAAIGRGFARVETVEIS